MTAYSVFGGNKIVFKDTLSLITCIDWYIGMTDLSTTTMFYMYR